MEILSIINKLEGTNIPIIMVAAGILFLLLSLSGGISGKIVIPLSRQKWAAMLGTILLVLGLILSIPELIRSNETKNNNNVIKLEDPNKITKGQRQVEAKQRAELERRRLEMAEAEHQLEKERRQMQNQQNWNSGNYSRHSAHLLSISRISYFILRPQ